MRSVKWLVLHDEKEFLVGYVVIHGVGVRGGLQYAVDGSLDHVLLTRALRRLRGWLA
jgi:hypothetical protein